jgi:hypothetical protein
VHDLKLPLKTYEAVVHKIVDCARYVLVSCQKLGL